MKLGRPGQIYQAFFFTPASLSLSYSFIPPAPILPTDPNFNLLSLSLSSIFRPPQRIFPFDVSLSPPTYVNLPFTAFNEFYEFITDNVPGCSVNLYPDGEGPLLSIETIPSFFYPRRRATPVSISEISETRREGRRSWKWWPRSPRDG